MESREQLTQLCDPEIHQGIVAGTGGGSFEVVDVPIRLLPAVQRADGRWWQLVPNGRLDVRQFGAIGDGRADDTGAIQRAVDCAIHQEGTPWTVFLPAGLYRTTDTIHVGYGNRWSTVTLQGEAFCQANGREVVNSLLVPDFYDRPCLNIQGGRYVHLRAIGLRGVNYDHLAERYETLPDRTDRRHWFGPRLPAEADKRTAPYAGVTIDAYAGLRPPEAYPNVAYPAFTGITEQYGRNFSSHTVIEGCHISGFCVGIALQPGLVPEASNGDFVTVRDCHITYNLTGIAVCQSDARCNNIENSRLHFNYTALDGVNYGNGRGQWLGAIIGSSFDNVVRLLDIDAAGSANQWGFAPIFVGCYGESIYSLGRFLRPDASRGAVLTFEQCKFQFSIKGREFAPRALLQGRGGVAVFRSCLFMGGFGLIQFDCAVELRDIEARQVFAAGGLDEASVGGRRAAEVTRGFVAQDGSQIVPMPTRAQRRCGDAFAVATAEGAATILPWWADLVSDAYGPFSVGKPTMFGFDRAHTPLDGLTWDGADVSFSVPRTAFPLFAATIIESGLIAPGDLVFDPSNADVYFVKAAQSDGVDAVRLTLRCLTGLRWVRGDHATSDRLKASVGRVFEPLRQTLPTLPPIAEHNHFETDRVLSADHGILRIMVSRRYYPAERRAEIFAEKGATQLRLRDPALRELPVALRSVGPGDIVPLVVDWALRGPALVRRVVSADHASGIINIDKPLTSGLAGACPTFLRVTE